MNPCFDQEKIDLMNEKEAYQYAFDRCTYDIELMKEDFSECDKVYDKLMALQFWNARLEFLMATYTAHQDAARREEKCTFKLTPFIFVTVNPIQELTLRQQHQYVKNFCEKQKIDKYLYVIEQRGTTEDSVHGVHFHILHTHKYDRATHYVRETQTSFNKACGNSKNYSQLNMKPNQTENDIRKRLVYMLGPKTDLPGNPKRLKQQIDRIFRKKNNLQTYYSNDKDFFKQYDENNFLDI